MQIGVLAGLAVSQGCSSPLQPEEAY
jgi:hypothetical protein